MTTKMIIEVLRRAIAADPRTSYRIWRDTGIGCSTLWRIIARARDGLHLTTLVKIADAVGYEVVVRKKKEHR